MRFLFFFLLFRFLMTYAPGDSTFSRSRLRKASHEPTPFRSGRRQKGLCHRGFTHSLRDAGQTGSQAVLCELAGPRETGWQLLLCLSVPSTFWLAPVISKQNNLNCLPTLFLFPKTITSISLGSYCSLIFDGQKVSAR